MILATIIEMIIPEGKNKKYIKTIIGMFILFSMISPIISKVTNSNLNFESSIFDNYNSISENYNSIDQNKKIIEVYKNNLAKEIAIRLEEKGYYIEKIELEVDDKEENFGNINTIKIKIKKDNNDVEIVNKIKIDIRKNDEGLETSENNNEIKDYLSQTYNIKIQDIVIY